jgi:F0F1-type ATP synthase delta subunit
MSKLSPQKFAQAVYEASKEREGKDLDMVLASTADFLIEKGMIGKSPEILSHLQRIIDENDGVIRVHVETAHPLRDTTISHLKKELMKRYNAKEVKLEIVENKNHLGGIKIQVADEVINLTLAKKLHQLQDYLNSQI